MFSPIVKITIIVSGAIFALALFFAPYINRLSTLEHKSEIKINEQFIVADVVISDKDREQGLSGRENLNINEGMLFIFDRAGTYGFWMKDMKIPIDIIWINEGRIVDFKENVDPQVGAKIEDLKTYYPSSPADQVLELASGRVKLLKVKVGDVVKIRPLILGAGKNRLGL
ncbi:MAG: DUF192 domain-containing protein [Patescibacteria group bacterium]